jgi:tRNA(adenine34) deaminase
MPNTDIDFLSQAVDLALAAAQAGEYPIGALLVDESGTVIASAANTSIQSNVRLQHAEMRAMQAIPTYAPDVKIPPMTLYTSLEPCLMCFGGAVVGRVHRIVYACRDVWGGASAFADPWPLANVPIPILDAEPFADLRDASARALIAFFARTGRIAILRVWERAGYRQNI